VAVRVEQPADVVAAGVADHDGLDVVAAQPRRREVRGELAALAGQDLRAEAGVVEHDIASGADVHGQRPVVDGVGGQARLGQQRLGGARRRPYRVVGHWQDGVAVVDDSDVDVAEAEGVHLPRDHRYGTPGTVQGHRRGGG
jgi:hypothetical protein